ncbi:TCP-1/cpn60 family chaperonin, putative [Eimeria necatrix]|uniref:CCT-theta n=1 Tax=Eimeria necatrix TaxID=51315 RepID=U6MXU3_9EIME|nr:TCP-1/cpn60 family chaperonin, putative [Eimeria necatrix]CDJ68786.1 TCP-1/cpn60 family chaperonin, putative [Eimeria necatrix]
MPLPQAHQMQREFYEVPDKGVPDNLLEMFAARHGLGALLKDGYRTFTGIDEVTAKNIEACKTLTDILKTSLGPYGLSKLVVNAWGKRSVTNDTAAILKDLEVQHPAAKLLVMAAEMQKQEMGGGCNFLLILAGHLLTNADYLLRQGLHLSDVIQGYELALDKIPAFLEETACHSVENLKDAKELEPVLKTVLASKPICSEAGLSGLLASAISSVMPPKFEDFDPDNIRVAKLQGGRLNQSTVLNGMVITKPPHGTVESKKNCKVMVLGCGLECSTTEAKGTVLIHTAEELKNFTKGEESQMEDIIKDIKNAGVEAIIVHGGGIADIAQHFCNKYDILTIKVPSKFETRRLCRALGATALVRLGVPMADELGVADSIETIEISSTRVTQILCRDTRVQTVVLRGSTPCILDEAEKAVDDACAFAKALTKDRRFVAGAGAAEMEIARKLQAVAEKLPGVNQYAVLKAAEAFEAIPRLLAESAGLSATEVLAALHAAHSTGRVHEGVNVEAFVASVALGRAASGGSKVNMTLDAKVACIFDHMQTKAWATRLAFDAAITALRVDQIIMARPAGGPAPRAPGAPDAD